MAFAGMPIARPTEVGAPVGVNKGVAEPAPQEAVGRTAYRNEHQQR